MQRRPERIERFVTLSLSKDDRADGSRSKRQLMEPIVQQPASGPRLTYAEFLEFVADKEERYEFVDGHAVAMGIRATKTNCSRRTSPTG
jgi:hypothetical protein